MRWNREGRKKELWEKDKNSFQRAKINFKIAFEKWNRKTHGLGMFFILILVVLIALNIMPYLIQPPKDTETQQLERIIRCMKAGSCVWGV